MTAGAHSEREVNVVKSLFSNIMGYQAGQFAVQKKA